MSCGSLVSSLFWFLALVQAARCTTVADGITTAPPSITACLVVSTCSTCSPGSLSNPTISRRACCYGDVVTFAIRSPLLCLAAVPQRFCVHLHVFPALPPRTSSDVLSRILGVGGRRRGCRAGFPGGHDDPRGLAGRGWRRRDSRVASPDRGLREDSMSYRQGPGRPSHRTELQSPSPIRRLRCSWLRGFTRFRGGWQSTSRPEPRQRSHQPQTHP